MLICPMPGIDVALRKESVDRNVFWMVQNRLLKRSLSARRAWIEIKKKGRARRPGQTSLSARRAWIEIDIEGKLDADLWGRSPQGERG